jgi:hypothetical protein
MQRHLCVLALRTGWPGWISVGVIDAYCSPFSFLVQALGTIEEDIVHFVLGETAKVKLKDFVAIGLPLGEIEWLAMFVSSWYRGTGELRVDARVAWIC